MMTVDDILKATGGKLLCGTTRTKVRGVSINSRALRKGELFIAIKGARLNGHAFVPRALRGGAAAIIVSQKIPLKGTAAVIRVADTTKALGQLAAWHRRRFKVPVIAVTGSTGKTTTKDMIAAVLSPRGKVLKSLKSENNQYGVPLTLLRLNQTHRTVVLEVGTNHPGEIRRLTAIAAPTVAVFTNIGASHLEGLKTSGGVFREKLGLAQGTDTRGYVVVNNDDAYLRRIRGKKFPQRILTYAIGHKADVRARDVLLQDVGHTRFDVGTQAFVLRTPVADYVANALAAISCGRIFKIRYNTSSNILRRFVFGGQRQEIKRLNGLFVIDDTYNANPVSFESALSTLERIPTRGRKILVTGDMLELGRHSRRLHETQGKRIARAGVDAVVTVGKYSRHAARVIAKDNPRLPVKHFPTSTRARRCLKALCRRGDVVLVKGSRGMQMETIIASLDKRATT